MSRYLHVRLTVANSALESFLANAKAFLATRFLEDNGWKLLAAMEVDKASDYALVTPPVKEASTTFVNLWQLPEDKLNLAEVMFQLSEYGPYVALDNDVTHEIQEILYCVNSPDGVGDDALGKKLKSGQHGFAMVRHYPSRQNLAEFAVSAGALAGSFAEQGKFTFAGTYQNITGLLNEFWDFWLLEKTQSCDGLRKTLAGMIEAEKGLVGDSYRHSIEFKNDGPDDGILILKKARFWQ